VNSRLAALDAALADPPTSPADLQLSQLSISHTDSFTHSEILMSTSISSFIYDPVDPNPNAHDFPADVPLSSASTRIRAPVVTTATPPPITVGSHAPQHSSIFTIPAAILGSLNQDSSDSDDEPTSSNLVGPAIDPANLDAIPTLAINPTAIVPTAVPSELQPSNMMITESVYNSGRGKRGKKPAPVATTRRSTRNRG
jgi:hypothetical protein